MNTVSERLSEIKAKINEAEKKAGRELNSVKLLAVSKFHSEEAVMEAYRAGQFSFGENRVQEAYSKFSEVYKNTENVELHIIGQLQSNKVKKAVEIASFIESVDRLSLIKEIEKQAAAFNKNIKILFEYHTGEDSKSGFESYELLKEAVQYCAEGNAPHIIPKGFMTMAPFTDDTEKVRASFVKMRETAENLKKEFPSLDLTELSMGMSGDFEIAIQEGSTEVRIGTAIFGERIYS